MVTPVLGLDVGGTKVAAGVASWPGGRIITRRTIPTDAQRGGRAVLDDVLKLVRDLVAEIKAADQQLHLAAIGLGICELVDREGRLASENCIRWLDLPVRDELSVIAPTFLEADVRAAALAEAVFGAGQRRRTFVYLTVGTGISCCLTLDGQPYLGARGFPGTMASSPITVPCEHDDALTGRTLEELASGPALVARFNAAGGRAARGHDVLVAAKSGDPAATQVVRSATEALGSQLAILIGTFDPESVIVGGGLGLSEGLYWDQFVAATRRHIWSDRQRDLPIERAQTGTDAGWLGAATAAQAKFLTPMNANKRE